MSPKGVSMEAHTFHQAFFFPFHLLYKNPLFFFCLPVCHLVRCKEQTSFFLKKKKKEEEEGVCYIATSMPQDKN